MTPEELADIAEFKRKFSGIPAHKVAMAMTRVQHGVDFSRCSKEMLSESWALRKNTRFGHRSMIDVTLDMIMAKINECYPNNATNMDARRQQIPKVDIAPTKVLTSRELFEQWMARVRIYANFTRDPQNEKAYQDFDTDWLWQAWQAGRKS